MPTSEGEGPWVQMTRWVTGGTQSSLALGAWQKISHDLANLDCKVRRCHL